MNLRRAQLGSHQRLLFKVLVGGLLVGGALLLMLGQESIPNALEAAAEPPLVEIRRTPEDKNFWLFKAEHQLAEQSKIQEALQREIEALKASQAKQLEQLQAQSQAQQAEPPLVTQAEEAAQTLNGLNARSLPDDEEDPPLASASIFSETLALSGPPALPHIDRFIPAGSYVKARLLNGLDISAGVSSQANPQPVLLRLVDVASLPNHAKAGLQDCRIIAAAHGELSNERVHMRLETLSCVQSDGHVLETEVKGFVNGADGKNGVRGKVVLRDAEVLKRGFMGGLLSGLGKASLGAKNRSTPFGAMDAKGNLNLFKEAGSEGVGDAFELMAKYNIQRAEQYQPVLQISAGVEVDVVFHAGAAMGPVQEGPIKKAFRPLSLEALEGAQP